MAAGDVVVCANDPARLLLSDPLAVPSRHPRRFLKRLRPLLDLSVEVVIPAHEPRAARQARSRVLVGEADGVNAMSQLSS